MVTNDKQGSKIRGWEELDVILFSGDAYVDHPSFGPAVIGRILESYGLRVAIVPQPSVNDNLQDFEKLGNLVCFLELLVVVWIRW